MRQTTGIILLLIFVFLPCAVYVGYNLYWFINCYINGGDWRYYASHLLEAFWLIIGCVAFGLLLA